MCQQFHISSPKKLLSKTLYQHRFTQGTSYSLFKVSSFQARYLLSILNGCYRDYLRSTKGCDECWYFRLAPLYQCQRYTNVLVILTNLVCTIELLKQDNAFIIHCWYQVTYLSFDLNLTEQAYCSKLLLTGQNIIKESFEFLCRVFQDFVGKNRNFSLLISSATLF